MNKQTAFRRLGTMPDCSRNAVMTVDAVKRWIDITSDLGYTALLLYTEETYSVENQPYFGHLRGRYTPEELKAIDDYAAEKGMEFIPCIQTLAHLGSLFHWDTYASVRDCDDILLAGDERTYQLVEDMFASLRKVLRTNMLNVGMDEAHMLGRGKYQDLHGVQDRPEILVQHLARVAEIAKKYDFQLTIWGDMFFRLASGGEYYVDHIEVADEVKAKIPENVHLVYWDYYSTDKARYNRQICNHNAIKDGCWFAGGLWTWGGFAPHNAYAIRATDAAFRACLEEGVQDVFLTMWGDDGCECSMFAALPSLFYAARLAAGDTDPAGIKAAFEEKYGISFEGFMLLDLPGTANYSETAIYNPEKYLLYNDCFMGKFDATLRGDEGAGFAACAARLEKMVDHPEYGYLFRAQWALCRALELKCDLGVRTRAAYLAGDKAALEALLEDYDELSRRLEVLYEVMEDQWMRENKPHGFDVQDVRLGGLACRVRHCRRRLADYLRGALPRIEELEEPVLAGPGLREGDAPHPIGYNLWSRTVTANVI